MILKLVVAFRIGCVAGEEGRSKIVLDVPFCMLS